MSTDPVLLEAQARLEARRAAERSSAELAPVVALAPWARHLAGGTVDDEEPPVTDPRGSETDRRRRRIDAAGLVDPDAAAAAAASPDSCPCVVGHPGSEAAAAAVERFVANPRLRTLALIGVPGNGKTWAATWALPSSSRSKILSANDIRIPQWDRLRADAAGAELLVVDDFGREPNDWAARECADLVESRYNRGARTILTSNLPMQLGDVPEAARAAWKGRTIADRYGDRLVSRLLDATRSLVVRCRGADLRRSGP